MNQSKCVILVVISIFVFIAGIFLNDHGGRFFRAKGRTELNFKMCFRDLELTNANDKFIFNDEKLESYVWVQEQEGVNHKLVPESSSEIHNQERCVIGTCIRNKKDPIKPALIWSLWDSDITPDDRISERHSMDCERTSHTEEKCSGSCLSGHCERWTIHTSWKVWDADDDL